MKIRNIVFSLGIILIIISCASYTPAPSNTIKVLAVTAEGDTIQLDVNSLRPRVYQNIYHSYPYYYSYWHPNPGYQHGWGYYYTKPRPQVNVTIPNVTIPHNKPTGTYNKPSNIGTGPSYSPSLSTPSTSSGSIKKNKN